MYIPKHFEVTDDTEIFRFIEEHGFGQLISTVEGRIFSTPLPFVLGEDNTKLITHVAKQNPQAIELEGQEVLVSFLGPHAYVSPTWYAKSGVPTWNYQSVLVYGKASIVRDNERNKLIVDMMSRTFEGNLPQPWDMNYPGQMLDAIVGIEIEISEIQAKYKLSQNRPKQDQQLVIEALEANGNQAIAKEMKRLK